MRLRVLLALGCSLLLAALGLAYVEAPYSLGQVCKESTTISVLEVTRVDKDKGLILFKKVQDLKGTHPQNVVKHNIGKRGFHAREWQNVMNWAEVGQKAVFFHNGSASETCIGTYWYQCYPEGEWWGMSHAEPFLLRTFHGSVDKLIDAVTKMHEGKEVVVTCLADGNKNDLHLRKGKLQRLKASLKRGNYDQKRDFVGLGAGEGDDDLPEFRSITLLAQSTAGWKFLPASEVAAVGDRWREPDFDDKGWRTGKAPIGYGEEEIPKRQGTIVKEEGVSFVFRRWIETPKDLLEAKGVILQLCVASDDHAVVYLNGQLVDKDPEDDHEFAYWNREIDLQPKQFKPGRNLIAVFVKNHKGSSDIYLDMEVTAQIPLPKAPKKPVTPPKDRVSTDKPTPTPVKPVEEEKPGVVVVDRKARTVTIDGAVAPRKLPNLSEIYPLEVVGTYPAPRGQKAHETVITFTGIKPSAVHKGLLDLGLKPGTPAMGERGTASGPEVRLYLEFKDSQGKQQRVAVEKLLVDRKTNKPLPAFKWLFTGSAMKQLDPEKDEKQYAADYTGTLATIYPVTDETVIQTTLTMRDEGTIKIEIAKDALPKEGTPVKLVIEAK
jgi:hypothetical protein